MRCCIVVPDNHNVLLTLGKATEKDSSRPSLRFCSAKVSKQCTLMLTLLQLTMLSYWGYIRHVNSFDIQNFDTQNLTSKENGSLVADKSKNVLKIQLSANVSCIFL